MKRGGAGGFIGSTLARMLDEHHAKYLDDQLDRGGILLWVRTIDDAHEECARDILRPAFGRRRACAHAAHADSGGGHAGLKGAAWPARPFAQ